MSEPTTPTGRIVATELRAFYVQGDMPVPDAVVRIEREAAAAGRERLRGEAWRRYDKGNPTYGQCQVCGEDGVPEADIDAFFKEATDDTD